MTRVRSWSCLGFFAFLFLGTGMPSLAQTREPILRLEVGTHNAGIYSMAADPSNRILVTGSEDKTARLWDGAGKLIAVLRGHERRVGAALFSRDGKQIFTQSEDGTVRLWDGEGRVKVVLRGHQDGVRFASFSPDGSRILTVSKAGVARLWLTRTEELLRLADSLEAQVRGQSRERHRHLARRSHPGGRRQLTCPALHRTR